MSKYNPNDFINAFRKRTNREVPACPFCGNRNYTTTDSLASIIIGQETNSLCIGTSIPTGMLICTKCGHIEFFALGALGLMNSKDEVNNGDKNEQKQK